VRAPKEARSGKAKITVSLPDWRDAVVEPAMFEAEIAE
jgi:hypothetical protein